MSPISKNVSVMSSDPSKGYLLRLSLVKSCGTKTEIGN